MTGDKVDKATMTYGNRDDMWVANKVRMLMRDDLDHEFVCVGARDRIMYLSQEVERLTALCDGYRGEIESAQEPPTCFDDWWKSTKYGLPHWEQPHIFMPRDIGRDSFAAGYRLGKKERQSDLTRAGAEGMEEAIKAADDVPTTVSVYPTFEQARGAASAKEQIIAAIRERATKGDSDEG